MMGTMGMMLGLKYRYIYIYIAEEYIYIYIAEERNGTTSASPDQCITRPVQWVLCHTGSLL